MPASVLGLDIGGANLKAAHTNLFTDRKGMTTFWWLFVLATSGGLEYGSYRFTI